MKLVIATILIGLTLCVSAFAKDKDHSAEYKVGTLQTTEQVDTGTFTSCDHGCMSQSTGHNVHYVVTDDGAYAINAPSSAGLSFLQGVLVSPNLPDVHIQWFLDDLHPGDKVLFAAECDKHNNCRFWLPKPDQQGKEYHTTGSFRPRVATTNTSQLCGTGKLSAAIEAQVCAPPVTTLTPTTPVLAPAATPPAAPTLDQTQIGRDAFAKAMEAASSVKHPERKATFVADGTKLVVHSPTAIKDDWDKQVSYAGFQQFLDMLKVMGFTEYVYTNDKDLTFTQEIK